MNVQLVSNGKGKVTAVQIPLKDWKELEKKLEAFNISESIKAGYEEMRLIERGDLQVPSFKEFLDGI
jgi:hypothetical protein